MKLKYLLFILIGLSCWFGCNNDNKKLTSSDIAEFEFIIPQGNNEYDTRIVDWFNRTGTYILYKFKDRDVYFNGSGEWAEKFIDTIIVSSRYLLGPNAYIENDSVHIIINNYTRYDHPIGFSHDKNGLWVDVTVSEDDIAIRQQSLVNTGNIFLERSKEEYVGKQFAWLEEMFLNFYPDHFLREYLPLKILLGSELNYLREEKLDGQPVYGDADFRIAYNSILLNHGDATMDTMEDSKKNLIKTNLNLWFIRFLYSSLDLEDFHAVSDIEKLLISPTKPSGKVEVYYEYGLTSVHSLSGILENLQIADFTRFVRMVLEYSIEELEREDKGINVSEENFIGIFHPSRDVNGLIRKKYDMMFGIFQKLEIDLQAMRDLYH